MESERKSIRRKPLSDCTNRDVVIKPSKREQPDNNNNNNKIKKKQVISESNNNDILTNVETASAQSRVSTPTRCFLPNSPSIRTGDPLIIYTRKRAAKDKGKMVSEPVSCPPVQRRRNAGIKMKEVDEVRASKSHIGPPKKKRIISELALPQDYVKEQQAYFAEIDRFELPVEEVSESELE